MSSFLSLVGRSLLIAAAAACGTVAFAQGPVRSAPKTGPAPAHAGIQSGATIITPAAWTSTMIRPCVRSGNRVVC